MKVFPVDSVVTTLGDDGLPVYDRPYVSADLRNVYSNFFTNGVFLNESTSLQVTAAEGGLSVNVAAGSCHINGAFGVETEQKSFELEAASVSNDRIDTVVARLDLSIEKRSLELDVLKGTPSASPTRPSLTRNETVWELGLADVRVPKGATTISQATVTDTRLEDARCGAVTPFAELDTTTLFLQLQAATDEAVEAMKDALDGTLAGDLSTYRQSLKVEQEIPQGSDLNSYTSAGNFGCSVEDNVAGLSNKPGNLNETFFLFVHDCGGAIMQEILGAETGGRWYRQGTGEWSEAFGGDSIKKWLLDNVYRVGYVWISYVNESPANLIGGTWTPITGVFPRFNSATGTGGSDSVTLTVSQMPVHSHSSVTGNTFMTYEYPNGNFGGSGNALRGNNTTTQNAGGGRSFSNLPAYQELYAWRRTA